MTDIPVALPVRTHIREYEIQELVGSGGFGFVYRATDHTLQRSVALKEYFPASIATRGEDGLVQSRLSAQNGIYKRGLESFLTEARVLAQFDDPAVVKVHFFWEQDGTAYMVMPFYDGITLRGLVRHHENLITVEWLKAFILRITDVLGRLHDAGTYHRDLSPENILILESGGLVLLDFGSSRQVLAGLTGGNDVVLKPGYAPIEQYLADDSLKQGPWTDLYGLGAVLHFLLEGKAPPASINRLQQDAYELLLSKRDRYPEVPPKILAGIDHCLAVQPDRRPPSVAKLRELFAISPDRVPEDFDLYQGVAKSTEFAATNTIAIYDENDLTIPLDPIAVLSPEVSSGILALERTAAPALSEPPRDRVPEVPAESAPAARRSDQTIGKSKAADKPGTEKAQSRQVQGVVGLVGFVLLCSVGLWLYLSISPPWKRVIVPVQAVQLKPSPSLEMQAGGQADGSGAGAAPLPEPVSGGRLPPPVLDNPARPESPSTTGTASMPTKPGTTPGTARPDPAKSTASHQPDQVPANTKPSTEVAATAPPIAAGVLRLNIKPWGKVSVNGQPRGASPPVNQLKLAPGKYQIEISNPGFPNYSRELDVTPGAITVIKHHFE